MVTTDVLQRRDMCYGPLCVNTGVHVCAKVFLPVTEVDG